MNTIGYLIKLKHRLGVPPKYIGANPSTSPDFEFESTLFDSLDEAKGFPFPFADVAAAIALTLLRDTKNISYEVIEVSEETRTIGGAR